MGHEGLWPRTDKRAAYHRHGIHAGVCSSATARTTASRSSTRTARGSTSGASLVVPVASTSRRTTASTSPTPSLVRHRRARTAWHQEGHPYWQREGWSGHAFIEDTWSRRAAITQAPRGSVDAQGKRLRRSGPSTDARTARAEIAATFASVVRTRPLIRASPVMRGSVRPPEAYERRRPMRRVFQAMTIASIVASLGVAAGPSPSPALRCPRRWASGAPHAGDPQSTHFSPLSQIDATNFQRLEVAWRFKTDAPRTAAGIQASKARRSW